MSWILGLRRYNKKLSDAMTAEGYIIWSEDLERISFKEFYCSLTNFRSFVGIQVANAQEELAQLFVIDGKEKLENVVPAVRLDIKDNHGESQPG